MNEAFGSARAVRRLLRAPSRHDIVFGLGFTAYLISFTLPAVTLHWGNALQPRGDVPGAVSAVTSLVAILGFPAGPFSVLLCVASGLINPLLGLYLESRIYRRRPARMRLLAILITILIPLTWPAIYLMDGTPKVGYFVWIAGLALMIVPDLRRSQPWDGQKPLRADPKTADR